MAAGDQGADLERVFIAPSRARYRGSRGHPVRAIAAGKVTWAGWKDNGGGYVVVIRHPDGMVSTYNHNTDVAVARGESVRAGQDIARVGATGWATGPHLDLRIEMDGRLINPLKVY